MNPQLRRLALDLGPLLIFFAAFKLGGFFVATAAFMPVIFWNALTWLQSEDDPDSELLQVARAERRRGTAPDLGSGDAPASGF